MTRLVVSLMLAAPVDPFGHLWLVGDKSPLQRFPRS
jgi:hypothetical protein